MTDVQVLLFDGLDELDAVAPLEILAAAGFAVTTVAATDGDWVTGAHGLRMGVDAQIGDAPSILIVPGGGWLSGANGGARRVVDEGRVPSWIAQCHADGTVVASVCSGSFIVNASGLLDGGRPMATHHGTVDALRELGGNVQDTARVIDDGDVLSAGGVTSGIDLSIHLVERYFGAEAATKAAIRIEHDRRGPVVVTERGHAAATA